MSDAGGYTAPGPILWESEPRPEYGDLLVLVARTPEHPSTDGRFTVHPLGGFTAITDRNDPETQDTWNTLARAIVEAERTIRAAWYEGGGGERVSIDAETAHP